VPGKKVSKKTLTSATGTKRCFLTCLF